MYLYFKHFIFVRYSMLSQIYSETRQGIMKEKKREEKSENILYEQAMDNLRKIITQVA